MSKRFREAVEALGARYLGELPDLGGGAFAAVQLAKIVSSRLRKNVNGETQEGSESERLRVQSVPLTARTSNKLAVLAKRISRLSGQRVTRRQVAALILERAVGT